MIPISHQFWNGSISVMLLFPNINSNQTLPSSPVLGDTVLINANVTSGDVISFVNFSVTSPNGTVYVNDLNGTNYDSDLWNSTSFFIDQIGSWSVFY